MKTASRFFLLCCLGFTVAAHTAQTAPSIVVDASGVSGAGFREGHEIAIFGAGMVPKPYQIRLTSSLQFVTADAAGGFRWQSLEPISEQTIWFAVDTASLDYVAGSLDPAALSLARLAAPSLTSSAKPDSDALNLGESYAHIVVVRPNGAVWMASPTRNGNADLNRFKPGKLRFDLTNLKTIRGVGQTPGRILPADFVLLVDPVSLRYYAGRPGQDK